MEITTKTIARYAEEMIKKIEAVKTIAIPQPETTTIPDLCRYTGEHFDADFVHPGTNNIYIISTDELPFNLAQIKTKFEQLKADYEKKGKDYCVSHINEQAHWENKPGSRVLYVGSTQSNAKGRFKQHLGLNDSRTIYALHIKDWWPQNRPLTITYFPFGDTIDPDSLQIIEDALWEDRHPLFGKKGGRNL